VVVILVMVISTGSMTEIFPHSRLFREPQPPLGFAVPAAPGYGRGAERRAEQK